MEQGNFFNQSHYQSLPNNEVNWGMLAQEWIHQNRPTPDHMQWQQQQQQQPPQPFHRPPGPPPPPSLGPPHGGNHMRFFNNQHPKQQLGPMFNAHYPPQRPSYPPQHQYPPRMDYFHGAPQPPPSYSHHQMPHPPPSRGSIMGRPPNLYDVRPPQWGGGGPEFSQRPLHPRHEHHLHHQQQRPQAPLFPSAANTRPSQSHQNEQDPYHWPEQQFEAPPPPPPPTWLESNGTKDSDGDYSALDTNERKQLPAWIREGLEQMEKEKRLREEKEERRKLQEAAGKAREEARKAKGKGKFDSDSEEEEAEEEPVRRKFEEYPDRRPLTNAEKEHLTNEAVKSILIQLLLESTNKLLRSCTENAFTFVKTKRAKVVVNKKTSALAALATLGGSSSEEEEDNDNEDGITEIVKTNDEKNGKSGETKVEVQKADGGYLNDSLNRSKRHSRSRSRSPHHSRSKSPKEQRHRYHSSRDDDYEEDSSSRDHRRFSEGSKGSSRHRSQHHSRD
uniref:Uncharacterized protein n=1 Tax=Panagrolaimus superbus TaxID=310955 RepID=A0A914YVI7_9BILA